jgi:hypothetical protein
MLLGFVTAAHAAPPVELELVTERGVQITAPHEWLQLLAGIGIEHVRIRGIQAGDQPKAENRGTSQAVSYHVVGVLTAKDMLRLPGAVFSRADRIRLKEYFERLAADGSDSVTAPRVNFGLTPKELAAVLADLAQPVDFETKGLPLRAIVDRLQTKRRFKLVVDADASRKLQSAPPALEEMKGVAAGTALAILLRNEGLRFRPEKPVGLPIVQRLVAAAPDANSGSTLGKTSARDMQYWPIGWEPAKSPGETAPSLMESLNAEIDGYTLEEALAAIGPRLKLPMYIDRAALAAHQIDPAKVQVTLARTRTSYKRVIDRVLFQAQLGSDIRVDEAGRAFLWITR